MLMLRTLVFLLILLRVLCESESVWLLCLFFFLFCDGKIWLCCKISNRVFGLKELFNPVYDVMYFLNIELTAILYI